MKLENIDKSRLNVRNDGRLIESTNELKNGVAPKM